MSDVLEQLSATLAERKTADPELSYVAKLHQQGLNKILEKVGEEAVEVILAAKDSKDTGERRELIGEVADLWFHTLVLLSYYDLPPEKIYAELERRFGLSGLEEKASRTS